MRFDISITKEFTPEIISYIQDGIDRTNDYCIETVESIKLAVQHDQGNIYTIKYGQELFGVMVSSFTKGTPKNFFTIFILSGKDIDLWRQQFHDFIIETIKIMNARLVVTGRKGWIKIFPVLKEVGRVYTLD